MGGPGSGRWGPGYRRKTAVEDCHALDAGRVATVSLATEDPKEHLVRLSYGLPAAGEEARQVQEVQLVPTPGRAGGGRWWFRCSCGRRVAHLYLPPRGLEFACRTCHELTYTSAQEAHKFDAMFARMAADMGMPGEGNWVRRTLERRYAAGRA